MSSRVLVVDDDPAIAGLVAAKFEEKGYKVFVSHDAAESFNQAEAFKPLLLVTDLQMPVWGTGADTIRRLRQHRRLADVPVLVVTGLSPEAAKKLLGADDPKVRVVFKPVDWDLLWKSVAELTGGAAPAA